MPHAILSDDHNVDFPSSNSDDGVEVGSIATNLFIPAKGAFARRLENKRKQPERNRLPRLRYYLDS